MEYGSRAAGCYTGDAMDVEQTMQFIREQQAATAVKLDKSAIRQDEIDRQTRAIEKFIQAEMKRMARRDRVTNARSRAGDKQTKALAPGRPRTGRSFDERMRVLIDLQRQTEKKLNRLIALLGRGRKGRNSR